MKKLTRFAIGLSILSITGCSNGIFECEYEVISSSDSPDGALTAYLIDVGCGATTGFVSWVAVSETGLKLNPKIDKTAVLEGKATKIYWINDKVLGVNGDVQVFKIENRQYEIRIE